MSDDEKWALEFILKLAKEARSNGLVCTIDPRNGEMPACWDSDEGGMAFTWKNAVIVCQRNPYSMREVMPGAKPLFDQEWKIKCAISCHYCKGMNPKSPDIESAMPFLVVAQMVNKNGQSFLKKFTPEGIVDGEVEKSILPDDEAFKVLIAELILDDEEMPVKIEGGISAASILATGEDHTKNTRRIGNKGGSGCLSVIVAVLCLTIFCVSKCMS